MPAVAYDLKYFEPAQEKNAQIKIAKKKKPKSERNAKRLKMFGNLVMILVVAGLACGVLYTQTVANELTAKIAKQNKEFTDQTTLYAYLNFEMDSAASLKNIEEKAKEMGMVKANGNQITHVKVDDDEVIEKKDDLFDKISNQANNKFLSAMDYLAP